MPAAPLPVRRMRWVRWLAAFTPTSTPTSSTFTGALPVRWVRWLAVARAVLARWDRDAAEEGGPVNVNVNRMYDKKERDMWLCAFIPVGGRRSAEWVCTYACRVPCAYAHM